MEAGSSIGTGSDNENRMEKGEEPSGLPPFFHHAILKLYIFLLK